MLDARANIHRFTQLVPRSISCQNVCAQDTEWKWILVPRMSFSNASIPSICKDSLDIPPNKAHKSAADRRTGQTVGLGSWDHDAENDSEDPEHEIGTGKGKSRTQA